MQRRKFRREFKLEAAKLIGTGVRRWHRLCVTWMCVRTCCANGSGRQRANPAGPLPPSRSPPREISITVQSRNGPGADGPVLAAVVQKATVRGRLLAAVQHEFVEICARFLLQDDGFDKLVREII